MNATEETGCMQVISPAQSVLHHHYLANVPAFAGSAPHTIHPDHFPDDGRQVTVPCKRGDGSEPNELWAGLETGSAQWYM